MGREPLAEAVTAFFRRGGAPATRRVICRHQESFYCPLLEANREKCEAFVTRARRMRITLPGEFLLSAPGSEPGEVRSLRDQSPEDAHHFARRVSIVRSWKRTGRSAKPS